MNKEEKDRSELYCELIIDDETLSEEAIQYISKELQKSIQQ